MCTHLTRRTRAAAYGCPRSPQGIRWWTSACSVALYRAAEDTTISRSSYHRHPDVSVFPQDGCDRGRPLCLLPCPSIHVPSVCASRTLWDDCRKNYRFIRHCCMGWCRYDSRRREERQLPGVYATQGCWLRHKFCMGKVEGEGTTHSLTSKGLDIERWVVPCQQVRRRQPPYLMGSILRQGVSPCPR